MMGRVSFAEAIYLLLMGDLPTPAIGRMIAAMLVSSRRSRRHAAVDARGAQRRHDRRAAHGRRRSGRAGVRAHHGGDMEACMRMLDAGLDDDQARQLAAGGRRSASSTAAWRRDSVRPASATGCTRAIRAPCA